MSSESRGGTQVSQYLPLLPTATTYRYLHYLSLLPTYLLHLLVHVRRCGLPSGGMRRSGRSSTPLRHGGDGGGGGGCAGAQSRHTYYYLR